MSSVSPIEHFLLDLDAHWGPTEPRLPLKVIGSTALMLQADYLRGTKDSDVLGVEPVRAEIRKKLLDLAGEGSSLHQRHRIHIDVVAPGIPFLPHPPRFVLLEGLNAQLQAFQISALEVLDVVVSKLKPFRGSDRDDVRAMVDMDLVEHRLLIERFRSAVDSFTMDARADDLPAIIQHLHWVERECFASRPTPIQLPPWVDAD